MTPAERAKEQRLEEIRAAHVEAQKMLSGGSMHELLDMVDQLRAENTRLREALEDYGQHDAKCMAGRFKERPTGLGPYVPLGPCTCGLSAALSPKPDGGT